MTYHYHEALFVDGPWAGEYRKVITGVSAVFGPPAPRQKWWQVGLLRPSVLYRLHRVTHAGEGTMTANGYRVNRGQGVFAAGPVEFHLESVRWV